MKLHLGLSQELKENETRGRNGIKIKAKYSPGIQLCDWSDSVRNQNRIIRR